MAHKILIAEDIDSINTGIISTLKERYDFEIEHVNTCDNAYLKIIKANKENCPFDLLISDLSFKTNGLLSPKLQNGEELTREAKKHHHQLKTIIYTIEDKPSLLKRLKEELEVNGIVLKGLNSLTELCNAIDDVLVDKNYYTAEVLQIIKNDVTVSIESYDIKLLELLAKGLSQQEISLNFKENNIKPASISAIEKRIGDLKSAFKANNSIHLVAIAKDMWLI